MTNASNDTPRPGEMTDGQLDQLLKAASANLLDYVEAAADPNRTLSAIMCRTDQQAPGETPVSVMIRFRDAAHEIASVLAQAPTAVDDIERGHSLVSTFGSALIPDRASDRVRVLERIHDLGRIRSLIKDLEREVARSRDIARDIDRVRVRVRDLDRFLARASDLAGDVARARDIAGDIGRSRARVHEIGPVRNHARDIARFVNLIGTLDRCLDLGLARDLDLDLDRFLLARDLDLDRYLARDLDRDRGAAHIRRRFLARSLDLDRFLDAERYLDRYLDLDRGITGDLNRAVEIARDHADEIARDRGRDRGPALASALNYARAIAQDLDSHELDASGEDLSSIEIRHLDAVDGITWTCETTWPPAILNDVKENSHEIHPGVYQVHLGDTRTRHMLLTLA